MRFTLVTFDKISLCSFRITRPARALKDLPLSVLDKMPSVSGLAIKPPIRVYLDVGITYNNHLKDKNNVHNK